MGKGRAVKDMPDDGEIIDGAAAPATRPEPRPAPARRRARPRPSSDPGAGRTSAALGRPARGQLHRPATAKLADRERALKMQRAGCGRRKLWTKALALPGTRLGRTVAYCVSCL